MAGIVPPPSPSPGWGPKIDEKSVFSEWVFLVGKMILDPVGVFWGHLGLPSGIFFKVGKST